MKKSLFFLLLLVMSIFVVGCGDIGKVEIIPAEIATLQQTGIYDNEKGTVYLRVNFNNNVPIDPEVMSAIDLMEEWEEKNPNKRIVAMTQITGDEFAEGYGRPVFNGLLIRYEFKNS